MKAFKIYLCTSSGDNSNKMRPNKYPKKLNMPNSARSYAIILLGPCIFANVDHFDLSSLYGYLFPLYVLSFVQHKMYYSYKVYYKYNFWLLNFLNKL